jgi:hypothetical protein
MVETANNIWADGPGGSPYEPDKAQIRAWGTWVESTISSFLATGGKIYGSRAALYADLTQTANTMAWVLGDPTPAFNGIYQKIGAANSGSWSRRGDLPYSFIIATDAGAGAPDAIQATTSIPVSQSALIIVGVYEANAASPVTISFNGGSPLTIKTNSGNDVSPGGLIAGMQLLGVISGSTFRLVSDQVSNAIVAAAEAAQAAAEQAAIDANVAAGSLLFRIYPDIATAQAASISASASYIAIASFSPQPRFYKRFTSDPGAGDRFQSADGAWWQGLPLPGTTIDYVNAVQRTANASLVSGDLDKAHRWTIPDGATYTVTLPNPATNVGRVLDIGVSDSSRGILAVAYTTNPIGKYAAGGLFMWAGESMTLIARATEWEIIGGRCIPCTLYATAPGPDIGMPTDTTVQLSGWQSAFDGTLHTGAEHAINASSQIVIPRQGFYELELDVAFGWGTAPTVLYASAHSNSILDRYFSRLQSVNDVLHPRKGGTFTAGTVLTPQVFCSGGVSVGVRSTLYGAPQFKLVEAAQW